MINEQKYILYVCKDHLELAIDIIVDDYEKAPEMLTMEQAGMTEEQKPCARCDAPAKFVMS